MLTRLYNPLQDAWDDHFRLDITNGRIEAKTPVGRVTIFLLQFNDPDRMTDRKLLIGEQRYPCTKDVQ